MLPERAVRAALMLVLLVIDSCLRAGAIPLSAMHGLVFLQGGSGSARCLGVVVAGGQILTSKSCVDSTRTTLRFVERVSLRGLSGRFQLEFGASIAIGATNSTPISDGLVLISAPATMTQTNADQRLQLAENVTIPSPLSIDEDASVLEVDVDKLSVTVTKQVIYVDRSLCALSVKAGFNKGIKQVTQGEATACVLPHNVEARLGAISTGAVQHLLVKKTVGSEQHILLGYEPPHSIASDAQAFKRFVWLGSTTSMANGEGRIMGQPVQKIDTTNQFVVGIRATRQGNSFCTGSLIASRFVVTAAHCSTSPVKWVSIGSLEREGTAAEIIEVLRTVIHPEYAVAQAYDVMLIELRRPSSRLPIKLLTDSTHVETRYRTATVLGYGRVAEAKSATSKVLRSVSVPLGPSNSACAAKLKTNIDASMLCAGGESGKDACFGDSGGPLVVQMGASGQRLLGTVAFGRGCGRPGFPKVYTRISAVAEFLQENTISSAVVAPQPAGRLRAHA